MITIIHVLCKLTVWKNHINNYFTQVNLSTFKFLFLKLHKLKVHD